MWSLLHKSTVPWVGKEIYLNTNKYQINHTVGTMGLLCLYWVPGTAVLILRVWTVRHRGDKLTCPNFSTSRCQTHALNASSHTWGSVLMVTLLHHCSKQQFYPFHWISSKYCWPQAKWKKPQAVWKVKTN